MDINQLVNQHYENFSETDHCIWQYIYKHMKECPQYSLSELAQRCSVSNNSILSFCKKLGMDGYGELRVILKWQEQTDDVLAVNLLNRTYQDYYLTLDYLKNLDLTKTFELFDCPGRIFIFEFCSNDCLCQPVLGLILVSRYLPEWRGIETLSVVP